MGFKPVSFDKEEEELIDFLSKTIENIPLKEETVFKKKALKEALKRIEQEFNSISNGTTEITNRRIMLDQRTPAIHAFNAFKANPTKAAGDIFLKLTLQDYGAGVSRVFDEWLKDAQK